MKQLIAVPCLLLAASLSIAYGDSQKTAPPDLTGTWILDTSKSNLGSEIKDYILTIVHREPEIRFSKKYKRGKREISEESVYYTDGRPEFGAHQGVNDPLPETRWRSQKLIRRTVSRPHGSLDLEFVNYEEWSISADKQILTRTMTTSGPGLSAGVFLKSKAMVKRLQ
jgi:hypothetical protein